MTKPAAREQAFWEIVLQLCAQILFEFGSIARSARKRTYSHPAVTVVGILLLGGVVGRFGAHSS